MLDGHPVLKAYVEKVGADNIFFLVAAVAWNILLSAVPIAVGMLALTELLFPSGTQHREIVDGLSRALQGVLAPHELERVVQLTVHHNLLLVGVAVASALWGSLNVGFALSASFNAMFEVRGRGFIEGRLVDLGMFFVLLLLTIGIVAVGSAQGVVAHAIAVTGLPALVITAVRTLFTLGAAFILFSVLYAVYPHTSKRIKLENVWHGALLSAILFQVVIYIWPLYEQNFQRYGGFLFPFLVLVVWIQFFSFILLIGGEIVALSVIRYADQHGEEVGPAPSSNVPEHRSLRDSRKRAS